jgi:hypothetical protein
MTIGGGEGCSEYWGGEVRRFAVYDSAIDAADIQAVRLVLPHPRRDWAHPCHICTGTGLAPATSAPGLGSPLLAHMRKHDALGSRPICSRARIGAAACGLRTHARTHACYRLSGLSADRRTAGVAIDRWMVRAGGRRRPVPAAALTCARAHTRARARTHTHARARTHTHAHTGTRTRTHAHARTHANARAHKGITKVCGPVVRSCG